MAKKEGKQAETGAVVVTQAAAPAPPTEKKIAIVGCSDTKHLAPHNDPSWEMWGMNNAYTNVPRRTGWFEIHPIKFTDGKYFRRKLIRPGVFEWSNEFRGQPMETYIRDLAGLDVPVYMQQHWDAIPKSVPYPLQDITSRFGDYFTNSVSYMIALAIMQGATEIGCYGVDMATGCPAPDVKVLTADLRWVRADSLQVGDEVMAFDEMPTDSGGNSRRWKKAAVTACPKITKPCYRLKLEDGTEMIVSARHGWLTYGEHQNKWRAQENIITPYHRHDRPTRVVKVLDTWDRDLTWESGYLAGAFDAEGHISQRPRSNSNTCNITVGFAQKSNVMCETVEKIIAQYGFRFRDKTGSTGSNGDCNKFAIKGGKPEILRFLGSTRPPRLMNKFNPDILGQLISKDNVAVIESEFIGDHPVIGLETEAKTFIAEGICSHNSEYGPQRPSCEYFLGIAVGLGIKIVIPKQMDLLKTKFLYGFQEREATAWESKLVMMKEAMEARQAKALNQIEIGKKQNDQYIGAIEALKEIQRIQSNWGDSKLWQDPY